MGHALAMQHAFRLVSAELPHAVVIATRKLCASSVAQRKHCAVHNDGVSESGDRDRLRLPLKRSHVAHRAARLRSWFAALVGVYFALGFRNHADGDATGQKGVGKRWSAVVL